jgi:hypothetical protein
LVAAVLIPYIGPVARLFGFVALPVELLLVSLLVVLGYCLVTEGAKRLYFRSTSA